MTVTLDRPKMSSGSLRPRARGGGGRGHGGVGASERWGRVGLGGFRGCEAIGIRGKKMTRVGFKKRKSEGIKGGECMYT